MNYRPENIDDLFKKRLENAAVAPPPFVWDNVELALRKRRRRFVFWLFFTGLAVSAGLFWRVSGYHYGSGNNTLVSSTVAPVVPQTEGKAMLKAVIPTIENTEATSISAETAVSQQLKQTTTTAKGAGAPAATSSVAPTLAAAIAAEQREENAAMLVPEGPQPQPQIFPKETATPPIALRLNPLDGRTSFLMPTRAASFRQPSLLQADAHIPVKPKAKKAVKNCYDFTRQPTVWLVDAFAGPSLTQRELVSSPDNKPYLTKRLSTEHRDLAMNAGARASVMIKGNFLIRTGLQYDQMTEVFEYVDPDWVKTSIVIFTQNGVTTIDTIVEYGEQYQKIYNRFGMLDIPLSAGVEIRKGRTGFNINAGFTLNVLFWKRGAILSPDSGAPTWFTPGESDWKVFRTVTGLSATSSIQWFYHLKPRLRVFVEPYFRRILRPVTVEDHPVEQRYGIGGLRLGFTKILD